MLKTSEAADSKGRSQTKLRSTLQEIAKSSNLQDACGVAAEYFVHLDHDLVSVIFCSNDDSIPAIRPFRNLPQALIDLAPRTQEVGGCPPKKEAQKKLCTFDWKQIPKNEHPDLVSQRVLAEVDRLSYAMVFAVPVIIGRGIAIFSVGFQEHQMGSQARKEVINAVFQIATSMICRFSELATLFKANRLSTLQSTVLALAVQGFSNREISDSIGLGEVAVGLVIKSAQKELGALNLAQTVAKALALGEFSHMQVEDQHLI